MRPILKNKDGDKILSIYWFVILFLVAGAIVYMVASFYGNPYDVREVEGQILADRVAECMVVNGNINQNFESFTNSNLLQNCNLNFNTENSDGWNNDQYYIEINISNFSTGNSIKLLSAGNKDLKDFCFTSSTNNPFCLNRSMYAISSDNAQYRIDILSIVRKTEKNVR